MARLAFKKRVSTAVRRVTARIPARSSASRRFFRKLRPVPLGRPVFQRIKIPLPRKMPTVERRIITPTEQTKTQIRNLASFPKSASLLSAKKAIDKRATVAKQGTIDFTKNVFFLFGILGLVFLFNRK